MWISLTWLHISTMQTPPAEPGTPGSLCSQQEQALLGHDSSALFSTSAPGCDKLQLGLQSLHNEGPHPAVPKYTVPGDVLAPPILQLLLHVAPPQPHHRPFWGGVSGSSSGTSGTRCLRACVASRFCPIKVVVPKT